METFAELMQRLLELQSDGAQRSPELIAEDERLMDGLQKRDLEESSHKTVNLAIIGHRRYSASWILFAA